MATKDWKKFKYKYEGKNIDAWRNKKNRKELFISKQINDWNVSMTNNDVEYAGSKNFRTKPQALAFAKAYMRKN